MLFLRTFGGLALESDGKPGTGAAGQRARLAILAFIATAGESGVSRDRITALFWPESDSERAHGSLKQALYSLRRDAHEELSLGTTTLRLNPDVVRSDVGEFQGSIAAKDWGTAVSHYRGPFLDGIHLLANVEFERWIDRERARLAQSYASALETLAQRAAEAGNLQHAVQVWRQLAATDVLSARIARAYIRALVEAGDRETAIKHALLYEGMVRAELGTDPDPSVKQLANELKPPRPESVGRPAQVSSLPSADVSSAQATRTIGVTRRLRVAEALGIAVLLIAGAAVLRPHSSLISTGVMKPNERLLVADFQVRGADSTLGQVLASAMRTALEQSDAFRIVSLTTVSEALERMERPRSQPITFDVAREVAVREGIKGIVQGDVSSAGGRSLIALHLVDAQSGNNLATFSEEVAAEKELIPAIDKLSRVLRSKIGESLRQVRDSPPLERVTTGSLEALRKYTAGTYAHDREGESQKAALLIREAVALDTAFAMGWRKLAVAVGGSNMALFDSAITAAFRLRARVTPSERDEIIAYYYLLGPRRDRAKAAHAYEALAQRDSNSHLINLGQIYWTRREFARAESLDKRLVAMLPKHVGVHLNVVEALTNQGKLDEADSMIAVMASRFPRNARAPRWKVRVIYLRGRLKEYEKNLDSLRNPTTPGYPWFTRARANLALMRGQVTDYERLRKEAREIGGLSPVESPTVDTVFKAWIDAELRTHPEIAIRRLDTSLPSIGLPSNNRLELFQRLELFVAAYARAGRPDRAHAILNKHLREVTDTAFLRFARPSIDRSLGEIAFAEKRFSDALARFRRGDMAPDGPDSDCSVCLPLQLGLVFDAAGQSDSAIAMFEKYVQTPYAERADEPTLDPLHLPRVYERLGQLYEARGERAKASHYYIKFIELWKNADPEFQPRVRDARRRLARLSSNEVAARVP